MSFVRSGFICRTQGALEIIRHTIRLVDKKLNFAKILIVSKIIKALGIQTFKTLIISAILGTRHH